MNVICLFDGFVLALLPLLLLILMLLLHNSICIFRTLVSVPPILMQTCVTVCRKFEGFTPINFRITVAIGVVVVCCCCGSCIIVAAFAEH